MAVFDLRTGALIAVPLGEVHVGQEDELAFETLLGSVLFLVRTQSSMKVQWYLYFYQSRGILHNPSIPDQLEYLQKALNSTVNNIKIPYLI